MSPYPPPSIHSEAYYLLQEGGPLLLAVFGVIALALFFYGLWKFLRRGK